MIKLLNNQCQNKVKINLTKENNITNQSNITSPKAINGTYNPIINNKEEIKK